MRFVMFMIPAVYQGEKGKKAGADFAPPPPPQNLVITNAGQVGQSPNLSWNYSPPADFSHYRVYRRADGGPYGVIATPTTTSYTDNQVVIGGPQILTIYDYYVTAVNQSNIESTASNTVTVNGKPNTKQISDIAHSLSPLPEDFALSQNFPHPFNPETQITFALPEVSTVKLSVHDVLGREIAVLEDGILPAGYRTVRWNSINTKGEAVTSGVYFCRFSAIGISGNSLSRTIRMIVSK